MEATSKVKMETGLLEKNYTALRGDADDDVVDDVSVTSEEAPSKSKNKLGTLLGVYLPCLLSIFGAILFLRLPWAVGQLGFLGGLLVGYRVLCCGL